MGGIYGGIKTPIAFFEHLKGELHWKENSFLLKLQELLWKKKQILGLVELEGSLEKQSARFKVSFQEAELPESFQKKRWGGVFESFFLTGEGAIEKNKLKTFKGLFRTSSFRKNNSHLKI